MDSFYRDYHEMRNQFILVIGSNATKKWKINKQNGKQQKTTQRYSEKNKLIIQIDEY